MFFFFFAIKLLDEQNKYLATAKYLYALHYSPWEKDAKICISGKQSMQKLIFFWNLNFLQDI